MRENTKRCPGDGCGRPIEKGGWCFHMTYDYCEAEFCWECLAGTDLFQNAPPNHL